MDLIGGCLVSLLLISQSALKGKNYLLKLTKYASCHFKTARIPGLTYKSYGSKTTCDKQCGGSTDSTKFCVDTT
jgi:hypothetical protein